jgi:hypothetical protein
MTSENKAGGMRMLDYVAFLSGVDLLLSPFIYFLFIPEEFAGARFPFGACIYISGGKFFVLFVVWLFLFFLARRVQKIPGVRMPLHVVAGILFLILVNLFLFISVLNDKKAIGSEFWSMLALVALPTVVTYLLLLLRIRWREKRQLHTVIKVVLPVCQIIFLAGGL